MEHTRDNFKEAEAFREQLNARSAEYVEEILDPHFGGIIQFVKECEHFFEKEQMEELRKQERRSLALVAITLDKSRSNCNCVSWRSISCWHMARDQNCCARCCITSSSASSP
ncbi:hypothetical protein KR084_005141 [Drosophila pseudotakahashii]|nr:hypothetical protein KR084_005141 [Drosophila pseudotakahashii]